MNVITDPAGAVGHPLRADGSAPGVDPGAGGDAGGGAAAGDRGPVASSIEVSALARALGAGSVALRGEWPGARDGWDPDADADGRWRAGFVSSSAGDRRDGPGDQLGEELDGPEAMGNGDRPLPRQRDEFTCTRCFLVTHVSRQAAAGVCVDCG